MENICVIRNLSSYTTCNELYHFNVNNVKMNFLKRIYKNDT